MAKATFISADQDWQNESTTYWFSLTGTDYGTSVEFSGETYGIVESGPESTVVNGDGYPLPEGDHLTIAVRNTATVTDEIRAQQ